jgi:hypothetical protein
VFLIRGGYDWGYEFVELMFGQQRALSQGLMANFSIAHAVFPVCLGILIAGRVRGKHSTKLLWILLGSVIGAAAWDSLVDNDLFFRWGEVALAAFSGVVAYFITRWNRARLRVSSLNLPDLWNLRVLGTLAVSATVVAFSSDRLFPVELIAYASAIGLVSYFSRSTARSKRPEFENALLVLSPLFVCNALNVILNLISLALDAIGVGGADLGWRALLSAVLINCVAYLSLYVGLRIPKAMPERVRGSRLVLR